MYIGKTRYAFVACLFSMLLSVNGFGQSRSSGYFSYHRNAISGIYSYLGWDGSGGAGYYEYLLRESKQAPHVNFYAKAGAGQFSSSPDLYTYGLVQLGFFTGRNTHHFELSAGPCVSKQRYRQTTIVPSGAAGWRIQKPDGWFVYRMGVGFPDAIYVGAGFSFL